MNKWEYLRIYVIREQGALLLNKAKRWLKDVEISDYWSSLGKEGWELVNVVEEIGDQRKENQDGSIVAGLLDMAIAGPRITTQNQHRAVTLGYHFWFKRPFEPKVCDNCRTENNVSDMLCKQCGEIIGENPSPTDYFNRGNERLADDKLADAIADYDKAIHMRSDFVDAYRRRGVAHKLIGEFDKAIKDFSAALEIQPDDASTYYNRATVWRKKGEYQRAVSDFQKYLDLGGGKRLGEQSKVEQLIKDLKKKY